MVKTWHSEPTKKLIYNRQTDRYVSEKGHWTADENEAKDFPSVFQALEFCCQNQISDAELVFKFGEGQCEASMPLTESVSPEAMSSEKFPELHAD